MAIAINELSDNRRYVYTELHPKILLEQLPLVSPYLPTIMAITAEEMEGKASIIVSAAERRLLLAKCITSARISRRVIDTSG
jgi:hypothetical protein